MVSIGFGLRFFGGNSVGAEVGAEFNAEAQGRRDEEAQRMIDSNFSLSFSAPPRLCASALKSEFEKGI